MKSNRELLEDSPFLEDFEPRHLEEMARHGQIQGFEKGQAVVEEGKPADRLYILADGRVQLSFRKPASGEAGLAGDQEEQVLIYSISEPGRPVGWSAMVEPHHYRASAIALEPTHMLAFDRQFLEAYCEEHPDFGVALMKRILWVLGNRLRATRVRLVARRYEKETLAIRALLAQSAESLSVTSPLHKIPLYLESRLTLTDAFHALELLETSGDELERYLAGICLEILENVRKEMQIYQHLQNVFDLVAHAGASKNPEEVRRRCSLEFIRLFSHTDYVVKGRENLPNGPGHIFIMNHLINHPENTLPNDFLLTLDTHFVSSVILFDEYGQAPVRVVRRSKPDEFGHQQYYDRLGYIYVHHSLVDESKGDSRELREERRRVFLERAADVLRAGTNFVICPEGTSRPTEQSPVAFRAGAFRLAAHVKPEPLIVPIAVANFDKRITRTPLSAIIYPPFRLSDHLSEPFEEEDLYRFINSLNRKYRTYVREAIDLAASHPKEIQPIRPRAASA